MTELLDLPVEPVDPSGARFCRHHPDRRIRWNADPCDECRREGRDPASALASPDAAPE